MATKTPTEKLKDCLNEFCASIAQNTSDISALQNQSSIGSETYTEVLTWAELLSVTAAGSNAQVNTQLIANTPGTIPEGVAVRFTKTGSLDLASGDAVTFNGEIVNNNNGQIFFDFFLDETYPARWNNTGRNLSGSFGGNNERDPRWWGLTTSTDARNQAASVSIANNNAIAGAALSARAQNATGAQLTVILPAGEISVHRTIRLDGLRTRIKGQGANATKLIGDSNVFVYDTSHFILTEDYPANGITPMLEIGYEEQVVPPQIDQGFMGGVIELTLTCPASQPNRRIGGVMWESALQEQTRIEFVLVENYGGYAFGGPRYQRNEHNDPTPVLGIYPQMNQVLLQNLWMYGAVFEDSIAMSIFGATYRVQNVTVVHTFAVTGVTVPAIICGSRQEGHWANIHIEDSPEANGAGIGIHNPSDANGSIDRLTFIDINYLPSAPSLGATTTFRALLLESTKGAYACLSITNSGSPDLLGGGRAIEDSATGKVSNGYHGSTANGTYVALYSRQTTSGVFETASSDPAMLVIPLHSLLGTDTFNPASIADGSSDSTTVTVTGAVFGNKASASLDIDQQEINVFAYVSAADTVTVVYQNETGGPIDLANHTIRALVSQE